MRRVLAVVAAATLLTGVVTAAPAATAEPGSPPGASSSGADRGDEGLEVFVGELTPAEVDRLAAEGLDREDVSVGPLRDGTVPVEIVMGESLGEKLRADGLDLAVKRIDGVKASTVLARQARAGYEAFRSYSQPGGIRDELVETAAANPRITKLVSIGKSVQGQDIYALKVTKNAGRTPDGKRPAVLYGAAQHAREWITPEMVRRLMHHVIDGYGTDRSLRRIVNTTELWFLPVSNPDGYDYTFAEDGDRLWRKNLADNIPDGVITPGDGVDPNRNFAVKWGYDDEGSSPEPSSETYRGPSAGSEPETKALDALFGRIGFTHYINYHSAAELLLYGIGWQVNTPSPDDTIYEAMVGTDGASAVEGYDPDISAELYTTNGDTDTHATVAHGILGFTPEMTTCQTVSASIPDDEWDPAACVSGFNFPDDEELIQAEFAKNIPFALSVARSAQDPDDPVSAIGLDAPDLVADPFTISHGATQPVAVTAKRSLDDVELNYRVNGGRTVTRDVEEWEGGERYGDTHDDYYGEFRGTVRRTGAGDTVEVWFTGENDDDSDRRGGGGDEEVSSERFTYTVADDIGGQVLVLAAEDVTGRSPVQGLTSGQYADDYTAALTAAGYTSDVYDVDVNGRTAPHHLGVLSHYDAVVWETGNDIITREVGQVGGTAAELALDLELTVRDYLNEGGKLLYTGQYAGFAQATNGSFWYNPFEEEQGECTTPGEYPCIQLLNDFAQYWLGAYEYVDDGGTDPDGNPFPVTGSSGAFGGFGGTFNGGDGAANQGHTASFLTTSSFLPPAQFPQFASAAPVDWARPGAAPYDPFTGDWYLFSGRADVAYKRLTRTIDVPAGTNPATLDFKASFNTEADWDYVAVEAHTVGADDWTTLPDTNGHTTTGTGLSCEGGWGARLHPQLTHYQTLQADGTCVPTGTTGSWNAATGASNGWQDWSVDLSAYAGKQVEVSISYITDDAVQGLGVFLDDVTVNAGAASSTTSFEADLGGWTVAGPPADSGPNANDWARSQSAFDEGAAVSTEDTIYTGFGAEGLSTADMRNEFIARSMTHLLGP